MPEALQLLDGWRNEKNKPCHVYINIKHRYDLSDGCDACFVPLSLFIYSVPFSALFQKSAVVLRLKLDNGCLFTASVITFVTCGF